MSETNAKQQIVDKIKSSTNILVTVSNNPSVDELSAALGLSLLLNKMKKHATAVFSGEIPPAITFLDPEKTFENTVDSLRDFIIALDKEKADHLRYKVEGDVVKIFITPYRTTITSEDLDFSQGDYNIELVLALGVKKQDNLDKALAAHGQIFDDATVATIVAGKDKSDLGAVSWRDETASSLSEMMVGLGDALKIDKGFVDAQIATAFLSGIVAATERFSNNRTSARVMTIAAQLMGAGANQQLIASKFDEVTGEGAEVQTPPVAAPEAEPAAKSAPAAVEEPTANNDGTTDLSEGESNKLERADEPATETEAALPPAESVAGTLNVSHEKEGSLEEVAQQTTLESQAEAAEAAIAAAKAVEPAMPPLPDVAEVLPQVVAPASDAIPTSAPAETEAASAIAAPSAELADLQAAVTNDLWQGASEPTYGGTLSATTEAAAEEARKFEADDRNRTILSHGGGYIADQTPTFAPVPLNAAAKPPEDQSMVNPLGEASSPTVAAAPLEPIAPPAPTAPVSAPAPVEQSAAPSMPSLPPLPDFSTLPPLPPPPPPPIGAPTSAPADQLGSILPPVQPAPAAPPDPAQFKIPGQS